MQPLASSVWVLVAGVQPISPSPPQSGGFCLDLQCLFGSLDSCGTGGYRRIAGTPQASPAPVLVKGGWVLAPRPLPWARKFPDQSDRWGSESNEESLFGLPSPLHGAFQSTDFLVFNHLNKTDLYKGSCVLIALDTFSYLILADC